MWKNLLKVFSGQADREADLEREVRAHLETEVDEQIASGVPPADAHHAANRAFGNATSFMEDTRDTWRWKSLDRLLYEFRHAGRTLARNPGFFLLAAMTLAVGIGATSAAYSVFDAVLLRPLPYPDPDQLFVIKDEIIHGRNERNLASPAQFGAWKTATQSFAAMGAFTDALYNLSSDVGHSERIPVLVVSQSLFDVLGIRPAQGRVLMAQGDLSPVREMIVSDALWKRHFGDARLNGQSLLLGKERYDVVGVLPPNVFFFGRAVEALLPLSLDTYGSPQASRRDRYLTVIGRLRPSATQDQAQQDLSMIATRLGEQYPDTDGHHTIVLTTLATTLLGSVRSGLLVLLAAVGSLLLIACLNVSSLLLARSITRRKEIAVRLALGAGRADLLRQLLTEALLLALSGCILGLFAARLCLFAIVWLAPKDLPRLAESSVNAHVALFGVLCGGLSALVIFAVPAWQLFRSDFAHALRNSARGVDIGLRNTRLRGVMMSAQVGLALVLIVGAGLLLKSLMQVHKVDPGFRAQGAIAMEVSLPDYYADSQQRITFFRHLLDDITTQAGVEAAGITNRLPLSGDNSSRLFNLGTALDPVRQHSVEMRRVTPGYFRAMGMRLIKGRQLEERDTEEAPGVAVVNEAFIQRFLDGGDAIGKQVFVQDGPQPRPWQIVGVVHDVRQVALAADPLPEIYVSFYERTWHNMTLVVRAQTAPTSLVPAIRRVLAKVDPMVPLAGVRPLEDFVSASEQPQRFRAFMLSIFSLLAMTVASIGIYGVTAYVVSQRTAEIGIRAALGATEQAIVLLVVSWTMRRTVIGLVLGTSLSFGVARVAEHLLFDVSPADPLIYVPAVAILASIALGSCLLPALRAARLGTCQSRRT
jgi:putative ABC transport system permease protein